MDITAKRDDSQSRSTRRGFDAEDLYVGLAVQRCDDRAQGRRSGLGQLDQLWSRHSALLLGDFRRLPGLRVALTTGLDLLALRSMTNAGDDSRGEADFEEICLPASHESLL